jgi:Leucine-rich repeat (LRR) protein
MAEDWQPLSHAILKDGLADIELCVGGGGFAFTKLDCSNKEITDLGNKVDAYKQLRHVILSQNKITDLTAIMKLPHLLTLQADENAVNQLDCVQDSALPWCQRIDLSKNQLTKVPSLLPFERLRFAKFAENVIESLQGFGDQPVLEVLELQGNSLTSLVGMGCLKSLRHLNLESNQLTSLEGLDTPVLTKLDLGSNALESLAFIGGAPKCSELILTGCKLSGDDIQLPELKRLAGDTPELRTLALSGNPLFDVLSGGENPKAELLARVPQVTIVVGVEVEAVLDEDREAAVTRAEELVVLKKEADEQFAREEAERLAAEAEAKAAEAAAEGGE